MNTKAKIITGVGILIAGGIAAYYFFRKPEEESINKRETITITKD